ncbi:hypothetical protein [Galbibacter sp.]|jgi:hypothetical protein|uniref:hypothetical protein n=1 Tax=Galbibacter sp. TaxID=2918471 RepID=UPI003A9375FE
MKSTLFKIALCLWCIPLCAIAKTDPTLTGKYTKEKTIKKEFKVNSDALLKLENSYGNLYITSWDQNTTTIEVVIQTSSDSEKKAQEKLDEISIDFEGSSSMVLAKTIFDDSGWGWSSKNVSIKVNYTVKVPKDNKLDLSNDYGSIFLNEINGSTSIQCDYGSMEIGRLNSSSNDISFDYSSDVTFDYITSAKIDADYSSFHVQNAGQIDLEADYTKSKINKVDNINFSCDYGEVTIKNAINVMGQGDYLRTKIGNAAGSISLNSDYGDITIEEMTPEAENLIIDGDYTNVAIGYNSGYHFDLMAKLEYAQLRSNNDIQFSIKREKPSSSYYEGYHGSQGKNTVKLNIEYGEVQINKR